MPRNWSFVMFHRRPALDRDRVVSAIAVAAIHAAVGWALLTGLGVSLPQQIHETLASFDVLPPPPPPRAEPPPNPPRPQPERAPRTEGAAAPPSRTAQATPITAPDTPVPIPPPVVVAQLPALGSQANSGNAMIDGPGTGSGGVGQGTGSGRYGDGPGGGGGGGGARPIPLRRDLGSIGCATPDTGCPSVEVTIELDLGADGRVRACRVVGSSGDRIVDRETCPRAQRRLAFRPARNASGRAVPATITWVHEFVAREIQPEEEDRYRDD